jgi:hypothetical protein
VEKLNASKEAMADFASRKFVKVAPPTLHAGIGDALREAYAMDRELRSLSAFEELLSRLDRV